MNPHGTRTCHAQQWPTPPSKRNFDGQLTVVVMIYPNVWLKLDTPVECLLIGGCLVVMHRPIFTQLGILGSLGRHGTPYRLCNSLNRVLMGVTRNHDDQLPLRCSIDMTESGRVE